MSPGQQLLHLSEAEYWGLLLFAAGLALAGFYFAFRWFGRARLIENAPTARIRSAHQGYVELVGEVLSLPGEPVLAPLTGTPCCWYRYKIEKQGDKHWRSVESDTSDALFLLRDETGDCLLDPEGAEVTASDRTVWYGHSRYPHARPDPARRRPQSTLHRVADLLNRDLGGGRYRYTEERIYPGDRLYALGLFKSEDDLDQRQQQEERVRGLLRAWKQDRAGLLARFDLNRDGEIDLREWELVRRAALRQTEIAQTEQSIPSLHRLGATDSARHPFLISTLPEFDLVRRYRWRAIGAISLFFLSGAGASWLLGLRIIL
ncbi:MAG: E3 ubiquitin ligase family protein [Sedimenticola sp.]|nr:E3 ubiquitin ligase family protein [Sedimenticola sp.]